MMKMQSIQQKTLTLSQLRRRAGKLGLSLHKQNAGFVLVDRARNYVASYPEMTLEQVAQWLDDLEQAAAESAEN